MNEYVISYIYYGNEEFETFSTLDQATNRMAGLINSESVEIVEIFQRMPFAIKIEIN